MSGEMKDSGIEWIGSIPKKWTALSLKYILQERNLKNDPIITEERLSLSIDKGVTLFSDKTTNKDRIKDDVREYKVAYPNDIVANSMNIIVGAVGISKYLGCVSPVYYVFYSDNNISKIRFYDYLLRTKTLQAVLKYLGNGLGAIQTANKLNTVRLRVPSDKFKSLKLPVPPIEDQQRIADYLDKKCAEIDSIIENTKASIEEYKAYKQSVITEAVTKGLNPNVSMKDSGVEWIGEIPEHWETTKVKFSYDVVLGKMLCNEQIDESYTLENYLCATNIKWDGIQTSPAKQMWFSNNEKTNYLLKTGDIIVTEGGSVGVSSFYNGELSPCYIQNAVHRVRNKEYSSNRYFFYWMNLVVSGGYLNLLCNKATIAHFTREKLENTPILFFDITEQKAIVYYLDQKCTEINELIFQKQQIISELETYKKSLIYECVTGKNEVRANARQ